MAKHITLTLPANMAVNVRDWLNEQLGEIESGVEEGIYEEEDNAERIKQQHEAIRLIATQLEAQEAL